MPHNGISLRTVAGLPVRAIYPGKVVFAAPFEGYGPTVVVHHSGRVFTLYAGLARLGVRQNDILQLGQTVGSAAASLYFEIREENRPVDPLDWLSIAAGVRYTQDKKGSSFIVENLNDGTSSDLLTGSEVFDDVTPTASVTFKTPEEIIEPFLIQQGLLQRTPRGRMITAAAFRHLGLEAPKEMPPQMDLLDGDGPVEATAFKQLVLDHVFG